MKAKFRVVWLAMFAALASNGLSQTPKTDYVFRGGFPTPETTHNAYLDSDLNRAIEAYKFFYPTVSFAAGFAAMEKAGIKVNGGGILLEGSPKQLVFTPNSDTPYAMVSLDLKVGPIVVEMPAGQLISVVNDLNQRYVMDLGLPGPDKGQGGKHLIIPPGYREEIPEDYYAGTSTTMRVQLALRAVPINGDTKAAKELIKTVKIHPLNPDAGWTTIEWTDVSDRVIDVTSLSFETGFGYWEALYKVINAEPPFEPYRMNYGSLAALGIEKGKAFAPSARMKEILERAARIANAQMRVQSFADRTPERLAWPDRKWEWAALRYENGTFDLASHKDLEAREKWFYQAILESPAMFRRDPGAGSLYWLGLRDNSGAYLDGGKTYKLTVPLPVPGKLFWSVTIYDAKTRSQVQSEQGKAALRSMVELKELGDAKSVDLFFGPQAPEGQQGRWLQTVPGKGWFSYFRIYGPEAPAFDGSWKPGDFQSVGSQELQPTGSPTGKRGETEQTQPAEPESRPPGSAASPLGGQEWRLTELNGERIKKQEGAGAEPPDLKFDAEKKAVSGSTGINRLAGGYKLDANKLKFGNLATTRMAGPEELMKQETEFVSALESVDSWKRTGDRLELMSGDKVVAVFAQALHD
jgi:heat shock protein HslJ